MRKPPGSVRLHLDPQQKLMSWIKHELIGGGDDGNFDQTHSIPDKIEKFIELEAEVRNELISCSLSEIAQKQTDSVSDDKNMEWIYRRTSGPFSRHVQNCTCSDY